MGVLAPLNVPQVGFGMQGGSESQESARFTRANLARQLRELGVLDGGVLLVHMSYRAVRPVDGGPMGVIEALRAAVGEHGTLVMPAWGDDDDVPLDPRNTPVSPTLGVTAEVFRQLPGVV